MHRFRLILPAFFACACFSASPLPAQLQESFDADLKSFLLLRGNLQRALDVARRQPAGLRVVEGEAPRIIPREEKLDIWNTWSSILQSQAALSDMRERWRPHIFTGRSARRGAAFPLNHAAFLTAYRHGLELLTLTKNAPALDTILNEPVPELGLPKGTYAAFKLRFLNALIATEFSALRLIDRSLMPTRDELRAIIDEDSSFIWNMGKGKGPKLTLKNALAVVKQAGSRAWFPAQKGVSEWMGDTKVWRRHAHLISSAQVEAMKARLQPGDILFERHEWYLSNMGLPGFWTHAAFFIGTPEERRAFFQDPAVVAWVRAQGQVDGDFEKLLQARYPDAYRKSTAPQEEGHAPRILEAISEGVSFTSLERTSESDSLCALRPRLPKTEVAQAILRAFHYSGRPYDFNFDFETDASIVCSELIYKAFEPGQGMTGLRFPVSTVVGRKVSAPNAMVRQFAESASPSCSFVLFLDGFEKAKRALESSEDALKQSWKRPNWHILVQPNPESSRQ